MKRPITREEYATIIGGVPVKAGDYVEDSACGRIALVDNVTRYFVTLVYGDGRVECFGYRHLIGPKPRVTMCAEQLALEPNSENVGRDPHQEKVKGEVSHVA